LAAFLEVGVDHPILSILSTASVRQDVTGAEAVLALAEQEVRSLLPGARSEADLRIAAKSAVDALLRELANRAGDPDPEARLVTKQQIADLLGGVRGIPASDRWATGLREDYVNHSQANRLGLVEMRLRDEDAGPDANDLPLSSLLDSASPVLLSGRTGGGKTSAVDLAANLDTDGQGRVVVAVHAEAYVGTRLPALVADALSVAVGRPLASVTGQQALADPDVVLVVDGASEIPAPMRDALRTELQPLIMSPAAANVVLVGRDRATLAGLLPTSVTPRRFSLSPLDAGHKASLVRLAAAPVLAAFSGEERERAVTDLIRQVERPLGDAAGNPMLFAMALQLVLDGAQLDSDAAVYAATISRIAERTGMEDVDLTSVALGIVFAELLDAGRRFVYPYEYRRLLTEAARKLDDHYFSVDVNRLEENARRSGLLVPLGQDQVLVPVHDSYADYLAGLANARDMTSFPEVLATSDERRLEFAAQIGGVTDALATQICRDLPFTLVRLSSYDRRPASEHQTPQRIANALAELLVEDDDRAPVLWQQSGFVVASLRANEEPRWIEADAAAGSETSALRVAIDPANGALVAVLRLWRLLLSNQLRAGGELPARRPTSAADAADLVCDHVERRRALLLELIPGILRRTAAQQVLEELGPLGMDAAVSRQSTDFTEFPIVYRPDDAINVRVVDETLERGGAFGLEFASSSVEHVLRLPPRADAGNIVRSAIERLTESAWLQ
jgi:hypothetical protein